MRYKMFYIAEGKTWTMEAENVSMILQMVNVAKEREDITRIVAMNMTNLGILVQWDRPINEDLKVLRSLRLGQIRQTPLGRKIEVVKIERSGYVWIQAISGKPERVWSDNVESWREVMPQIA